jgi:hypothetical protein
VTSLVRPTTGGDRGVLAPRAALAALVGLGLLMLGVYAFGLARPYSLTRYVQQPLLDLGKIGGGDLRAGWRYVLPPLTIWLAYLAASILAYRVPRYVRAAAYGGAVLFSLALLGLYPINAADVFNYVLYGLAQHRGANPLVQPPADVIGPPLIDYSAWPAHPSPYGPAWQWIAFGVTRLTGENVLAGIVAFKLLLAACHLLNVALVERLAGKVATARPPAAALLYGWNPLILYETVGNGHNDIVMLSALLLALVAITGDSRVRVLGPLFGTLAALTKYVAALWLPVLALAWWWRRPATGWARQLLGAGIGCAILVAACYWGLWAGGQTFLGVQRQSDLYTTSFGALAMIILVERWSLLEPRLLLDLLKVLIAAALVLTFVVRRPRSAGLEATLGALFDLTLVYLMLGALWFQPWYLVPLVGLAPLVDAGRRWVAMAFALGATGTYIVFWPALGFTVDRLLVQGVAVTVTYGPALLLLVLLAGRRWGLREGAARAIRRAA